MRAEFLSALIGKPWEWRGGNCWDFARHVQAEWFGRTLPDVAVPQNPSWRWMVNAVARHPERKFWKERPVGPAGLVTASDGALVLMGRLQTPGHIGTWLRPEQAVIHCDRKYGVCCETLVALRAQGWRQILFFEPK